ncbi:efflux RND transporter periplasmic adaptor subunit [Caballeronia sp. Lep1P3]|uniref:efflux RND transporter periplasmic adaptor subunit n=1 Tax=Caballeronia sp. Lep1P3 TaxID=2878150 RepID=UPI001FD2161C|nr:efflux RND transporter periplasmic adaptor subunit [Caballeronia sp. Lep1P3]
MPTPRSRMINAHRSTPASLARWRRAFAILLALAAAACNKPVSVPKAQAPEVTVMTVTQRNTPVTFEFVAQTQSSREVEIRARVEGFLDKRLYTEGSLVKAGQVMFQMDKKPFEATLQTARGQLAQQQARLTVAEANLGRVRPLQALNAVSKKDLDDAIGNEKSARAAVIAAQGEVTNAELNLGYTTIKSPLTGLSSYARMQEGSYLSAGQSSLLTYVSQLDPVWVNFSLSENEILSNRDQIAKGLLKPPSDNRYVVEVILADGSRFPNTGLVDFINPSYSKDTGTFLVRAVLPNKEGALRPGQFVRARVHGLSRPNAILVPQRAVLQGAKAHYVWLLDKDGKTAHEQVVEVGEWLGNDWFIPQGLSAGDRVIVDGAIRVAAGVPVKVTGEASDAASNPAAASAPAVAVKPSSQPM